MDVVLRKLLTELSSHVQKIVANKCLEESQCACGEIFKEISNKLREFDEKLNTLSQQDTQTRDSGNTAISSSIVDEEISSENRKLASIQSVANRTGAVRSKRTYADSPDLQPVVKLSRLDTRCHSQDERTKNVDNSSDSEARKTLSQNDADSRYANARRKRNSLIRQTIAVERSFIEEDENEEEDAPFTKNTNQNLYWSNSLYNSLCVFCMKNERYLVAHYAKQHADHEVPISRPSPTMALAIRAQNQQFELCSQKIAGFCFFCEENKLTSKSSWASHILTHTGEPMYICTKCGASSKKKEKHANCRSLNFRYVYETNDTKDIVTGFMCRECNFLQIDKARMIAHLSTQHNFGASEVNNQFHMVTLLPDLTPVKSVARYGYITPTECFKCTICAEQMTNSDDFEAHFEDKHNQVKKYKCICGDSLNIRSVNSVSNHFLKHGADLYICMACQGGNDEIHCSEDAILNHISLEHAEGERTFQHIHRKINLHSTVTDLTIKKFICTTCSAEFDEAAEAVDHFQLHSGQMVDFKVSVTKKCSELDAKSKVVRTSFVADQSKYILRQSFLCLKCQLECASKDELLIHCRTDHPSTFLEVKLGGPMLIPVDDGENLTVPTNVNEKFDRFMGYSCYWCYNDNNESEFISPSAKGIHDHWLSQHTDDETLPTVKPFRFYVEPLMKCVYCGVISTYRGLQEHTERLHPKSSLCFININAKDECPLCDYKGATKNLPAHFSAEHKCILEVNMLNPNRFTADTIDQILSIDVHKKSMCEYCGEVFDLETDYKEHHRLKHPDKVSQMRAIIDNKCHGLLASCCQIFITPHHYFNHLKSHSFQYSCKLCQVKMSNMEEAALHDQQNHDAEGAIEYRLATLHRTLLKMFLRTKMIFGNGAVLYKHNVLQSQFDDKESFENYMRSNDKKHREHFDALLKKGQ